VWWICGADDIDDTSSLPESRAVIGRLQRQMLALLPHYCTSDLYHQQRRKLSSTEAGGSGADCEDILAQMSTHVYDVLANVIRLCSSLVTTSGTSEQHSDCLAFSALTPLVGRHEGHLVYSAPK